MVTATTVGMPTPAAATAAATTFEELERDLQAALVDQNGGAAGSDELNIFRSGSAPPTVEGARNAIGSLFGYAGLCVDDHEDSSAAATAAADAADVLSEEEIRSHPAYLSYYYSNERLNPRLPPPMISKEDWRAAQRFQSASVFGGIGDRRQRLEAGSSLFSVQPGMREGQEEFVESERRSERKGLSRQRSSEWLDKGTDGLIGLPDVGLGSRRKSFADALQENISRPAAIPGHPSRSNSRNAFESPNPVRASDLSKAQLQNRSEFVNGLQSGPNSPSLVRVHSLGSSMSNSFASALGSSLSRSTTPDPQLIRRTPSPCLPPVGVRMGNVEKKIESASIASHNPDNGDMTAALSAMSSLRLSANKIADAENEMQTHLYQNFADQPDMLFNASKEHRQFLQQKLVHNANEESFNTLEYSGFPNNDSNFSNVNISKIASDSKSKLPIQSSHANVHQKVSSMSLIGSASQYQNDDSSNIDVSGHNSKAYAGGFGQSMLSNQLNADGEYLNLLANQGGSGFQLPVMEPLYAQYLHTGPESPLNAGASMNAFSGRNYVGSAHMDFPDYQKAYIGALLAQQKLQYGMPYLSKSGGLNTNPYGSDPFGVGMPYLANSPSSSFISSPQGRMRQGERLSRGPSMMRSTAGGSMGSWNSENGFVEESYASSLLEEFKTNKTRSFELLDIVDHVVEFSSDQYGSRFIQQKLETASPEEKNKIFPEILPQARSLMTDVFGNYVIQKFFEYGTETQRKQMASLLKGYVLQLSLQMYGCRVIQKALEVVDVEQQTQMALELDGSIMRCVRDQNGNHVIQKCIECIPQDRIQFIISSFYGHVVELSTHPYGCRVIQRVLEYCDDENTQSVMMDEIMQSVITLTQDQYGNYVIQHVLQHGKPEERSAIITQLAGQIVKMSQQKFASNVVEKCLTYGTAEERQLLINEMLGSTDENEPLQVMMKDQFANYVVQKVLETCDDHNRELILSRIKVHLNALKRYTYGKHIVARVEKLITAGERRTELSSLRLRD